MPSTKHVEPLDPAQFTYTAEENEWLWRVRDLDWLPLRQVGADVSATGRGALAVFL